MALTTWRLGGSSHLWGMIRGGQSHGRVEVVGVGCHTPTFVKTIGNSLACR